VEYLPRARGIRGFVVIEAVTRRSQPAGTEDEGLLHESVTSDLCCPEVLAGRRWVVPKRA